MSQHKKHPLPVLLYDSECVLCNRFKQALEHVSGAEILTMVSIHEDEIYNEFQPTSHGRKQVARFILDRLKAASGNKETYASIIYEVELL